MKFRDEYFFLSNFYPAPFMYGGILWPTSEHAFQAYKSDNAELRQFISRMPEPAQAKYEGRQIALRGERREGWLYMCVPTMLSIVQAKFFQNPDLAEMLLATGDKKLIEENSWHDNFWGKCTCQKCVDVVGQNKLGLILMEVRAQLAGRMMAAVRVR